MKKPKRLPGKKPKAGRQAEWDKVTKVAAKARVVKAKPVKKDAKRKPVAHRVNTHGKSGSTSMEIAPELLPSSPILLPDPEESQRILKGLAELNDRAVAASKVYADLKERTKTAKEKWDGLAEEVQTKLRLATHGSDLPLFDVAEREADVVRMTEAASQEAPGHEVAPAPAGDIPEEQIPF